MSKDSDIEKMTNLQYVVYKAMCKNENLTEHYVRDFAVNRINREVDLLKLDSGNKDLVAKELKCNSEDFDAFLMITQAICSGSKCNHAIKRYVKQKDGENLFLKKILENGYSL